MIDHTDQRSKSVDYALKDLDHEVGMGDWSKCLSHSWHHTSLCVSDAYINRSS